jgi:hypothetical protein
MAYYWAVTTSVVLDDVYIYFRLAENFLRLGTPVFNAGDPFFIATSPLWTLMLAAGKWIVPSLDIVLLARALWLALLIAASFFARRLLSGRSPAASVFAGAPFLLSPAVGLMAGGEIALLYAAFLGALWAGIRDKPFAAGLFLGTGMLARGEFVFMALPLGLWVYTAARLRGDSTGRRLARVGVTLGVGAGIAVLAHACLWAAFGNPFPRALQVKMMQGRSGMWPLFPQEIWNSLRRALPGERIWLLPFAALGAWRLPKISAAMAFYTAAYSLAYTAMKIPAYGWYYYPFTLFAPLLILAGVAHALEGALRGTARLAAGLRKGSGPFKPQHALWAGLPLLAGVLWMYPVHFARFGPADAHRLLNPQTENERVASYREAARRLLPELRPGDAVLTPEVGIVSFYLKGAEVRDQNGLASPDVTLETMNSWDYAVDRYRPRFILFPAQVEDPEKIFRYRGRVHRYRPFFAANPSASRYAASVYAAAAGGPEGGAGPLPRAGP